MISLHFSPKLNDFEAVKAEIQKINENHPGETVCHGFMPAFQAKEAGLDISVPVFLDSIFGDRQMRFYSHEMKEPMRKQMAQIMHSHGVESGSRSTAYFIGEHSEQTRRELTTFQVYGVMQCVEIPLQNP
jgi:hypothetical protein